MYDIGHLPGVIEIGYIGENEFRTIEIDMGAWLEVMPDGVASIIHIRPGETQADAYITSATMNEDGILQWQIGAGDLGEESGYGQMQVWLANVSEQQGKSTIVKTYVQEAVDEASSEIPEAQESWMEQMTALKVATVAAADDANDAKTDAVAAKNAAVDAKDDAVAAKNAAVSAKDDAVSAKNDAVSAKNDAVSAKNDAVSAKNAAVAAQTAAETAQGKAEDAQTAAEAAQDAAEDAAAEAGDLADDAADAAADAQTAQAAAEAAQAAAETAVGHGPYIDSTTGDWMVWNASTGAYVNTGVKAHPDVIKVQDTQPTDSDAMIWFPETSPAGITLPTVAEMNTAIGALIDDTSTAQDKTWSADKLSDLNTAIQAKYTKPNDGIPATDLASGVIPSVPVQDVQVNGTSVLSQGVANVPMANATTGAPGVIGVINYERGLAVNDGRLGVVTADADIIKAGTNWLRSLVPGRQHTSIFYGLAKLAGADMASLSGETVGVYPDAQKIAIQKMLGIYEPPYELLNDITLNSESGLDLTADDNATPYNLLGVLIYVFYPANTPTATEGYARYRLYDSNNRYCNAETVKYTTSTSGKFKYVYLVRQSNLAVLNYTQAQPTGNGASWYVKTIGTDINGTPTRSNGGVSINLGNITRIALASNDVEPAGTRIQIFGQRAY